MIFQSDWFELYDIHLSLSEYLVYVTLKTGDLKNDIPDPAHRSWGGFV